MKQHIIRTGHYQILNCLQCGLEFRTYKNSVCEVCLQREINKRYQKTQLYREALKRYRESDKYKQWYLKTHPKSKKFEGGTHD